MSIERTRNYRQNLAKADGAFNEQAVRDRRSSDQSAYVDALDAVERLRRNYEPVVVELYRSGLLVSELAEQLGCRERDIRWITKTRQCSFCSRTQDQGRLYGGPNYDICELCMTSDLSTAQPAADADGVRDRPAAGSRCSYCDKVTPDDEIAMASQVDRDVNICNDCMGFAREWLVNEGGAADSG